MKTIMIPQYYILEFTCSVYGANDLKVAIYIGANSHSQHSTLLSINFLLVGL